MPGQINIQPEPFEFDPELDEYQSEWDQFEDESSFEFESDIAPLGRDRDEAVLINQVPGS